MRPLALSLAALAAAGCAVTQEVAPAEPRAPAPFRVVKVDAWTDYLIDPRNESCFLRVRGPDGAAPSLEPVPCARLKQEVPEAAEFITWDAPEAPSRSATGAAP